MKTKILKSTLLSVTAILATITIMFSLTSCTHDDEKESLSIYKQWKMDVTGEDYFDSMAYDFTSQTKAYILVHLIKDYKTTYKAGKWYTIESAPFKVVPKDKNKGMIYFDDDEDGEEYVLTENTLTINGITMQATHGIKSSGQIVDE